MEQKVARVDENKGGPIDGVKSRIKQPKSKALLMYQSFHAQNRLKAPLLRRSYHGTDKALAPHFVVDMADNGAPLSRAIVFLTTPPWHFGKSFDAIVRNVQQAY
jgi:hypothetical protein